MNVSFLLTPLRRERPRLRHAESLWGQSPGPVPAASRPFLSQVDLGRKGQLSLYLPFWQSVAGRIPTFIKSFIIHSFIRSFIHKDFLSPYSELGRV